MVCSSCGFLPEGMRPAWAGGLRRDFAMPSAQRPGQQEFDIMKKLLAAASVAASLAAGAVPAFAQSATTSQTEWTAPADNGGAGSVQAQNYSPAQNYNPMQSYSPAPAATSSGAHFGDGSARDYLMQQQELQNMPGYSPTGTN
jgi:hypothetical protein